MNPGIRATYWIAAALIVTVIFPLAGLIAGCVLVGMAIQAQRSRPSATARTDLEFATIADRDRRIGTEQPPARTRERS